jgi:hypothetical protein
MKAFKKIPLQRDIFRNFVKLQHVLLRELARVRIFSLSACALSWCVFLLNEKLRQDGSGYGNLRVRGGGSGHRRGAVLLALCGVALSRLGRVGRVP